jgi:hypothetical protein
MAEAKVKLCPFTGAACKHRETCEGSMSVAVPCWERHVHRASQPDGPDGLHRDSQG